MSRRQDSNSGCLKFSCVICKNSDYKAIGSDIFVCVFIYLFILVFLVLHNLVCV